MRKIDKSITKIMTTEEKAKAYDEALETARQIHNGNPSSGTAIVVCEQIFPELAESEDERMRKELIDFINHYRHNTGLTAEQAEWCKKAIAYLEKQKERGKNITANLLEDDITGVQRELIEFLANNIDASWVDIVKSADAYAQRIRSMVEKQKEQNLIMANSPQLKEQKPAEWSEEDEKKIHFLSRLIELQVKDDEYCFGEGYYVSKQEAIEMLKSLRPSWKPSEEQIDALEEVIVLLTNLRRNTGDRKNLESLYEQLKSIQ